MTARPEEVRTGSRRNWATPPAMSVTLGHDDGGGGGGGGDWDMVEWVNITMKVDVGQLTGVGGVELAVSFCVLYRGEEPHISSANGETYFLAAWQNPCIAFHHHRKEASRLHTLTSASQSLSFFFFFFFFFFFENYHSVSLSCS